MMGRGRDGSITLVSIFLPTIFTSFFTPGKSRKKVKQTLRVLKYV